MHALRTAEHTHARTAEHTHAHTTGRDTERRRHSAQTHTYRQHVHVNIVPSSADLGAVVVPEGLQLPQAALHRTALRRVGLTRVVRVRASRRSSSGGSRGSGSSGGSSSSGSSRRPGGHRRMSATAVGHTPRRVFDVDVVAVHLRHGLQAWSGSSRGRAGGGGGRRCRSC